jgi:hypothetical protein
MPYEAPRLSFCHPDASAASRLFVILKKRRASPFCHPDEAAASLSYCHPDVSEAQRKDLDRPPATHLPETPAPKDAFSLTKFSDAPDVEANAG